MKTIEPWQGAGCSSWSSAVPTPCRTGGMNCTGQAGAKGCWFAMHTANQRPEKGNARVNLRLTKCPAKLCVCVMPPGGGACHPGSPDGCREPTRPHTSMFGLKAHQGAYPNVLGSRRRGTCPICTEGLKCMHGLCVDARRTAFEGVKCEFEGAPYLGFEGKRGFQILNTTTTKQTISKIGWQWQTV